MHSFSGKTKFKVNLIAKQSHYYKFLIKVNYFIPKLNKKFKIHIPYKVLWQVLYIYIHLNTLKEYHVSCLSNENFLNRYNTY